ncbi:hypothetical protein ACQKP0_02820 [Heyndrickxia sp. NPDC080065]|uniref:hypothetical protein n=1 Tax=Heyndrickxia sp. NPDC080065 TaxID=3390568 RepID=UPI003D00621C
MSLTMLGCIALFLAFFSLIFIRQNLKTRFDFKNAWTAGGSILVINIILIGLTILGVFFIPFSTPFFIVISPVVSVIAWVFIKESFRKPLLKRLHAVIVGQSIYIGLFIYLAYKNSTIKPSYPGEDMFMTGLGYMIGMIVCFFATLIGVIAFLLPHKISKINLS